MLKCSWTWQNCENGSCFMFLCLSQLLNRQARMHFLIVLVDKNINEKLVNKIN